MVRVIMLIAHLQTTVLPVAFDIYELMRLAQVAEKYGVYHVLRGHITEWTASYRLKMFDDGFEEWLWIAYHFGLEDDYLTLADRLTFSCRTNETNELVTAYGRVLKGIFPERSLRRCFLVQTRPLLELITSFTNFFKTSSKNDGTG